MDLIRRNVEMVLSFNDDGCSFSFLSGILEVSIFEG